MSEVGPTYQIYVSRRGNVFMAELAALLQHCLEDVGRATRICSAGLPEAQEGVVNLVIAPHEYFHFAALDGVSEDRRAAAAASSVCVTTEQMGTPWFEAQVAICAPSPLVLDISRSAVDALGYLGLPATHLPLGYHSSLDRWGGIVERQRDCDLTVLAALNTRREEFLARSISLFWDRNCDIRMFTFEHPIAGPEPGFLVGEDKLAHLASSKVLLNIHRSDVPYFEWLRVIEALANGCVVASESSVGYQPLIPFEHFVQAPLDSLAEYTLALLVDDTWRNELAVGAYEFIRDELDMTHNLSGLLPRIEDAAARSQPRRRRSWTRRRVRAPMVASPPPTTVPRSAVDSLLSYMDENTRLFQDAAKSLLMSQRAGIRHLEQVESAVRFGTNVHIETSYTPSYENVKPDVSVVLTNYNYAHLIGNAIDSVVASSGVVPELIIVDDHSGDDSVSVIRGLMAERPWFPTLLVAKYANQGLSMARNTGFERARSDHVFVLDADNSVYPTGLRTLVDVLRKRPDDAFSYGIIDCFSDTSDDVHLGLHSCLPWDPVRLTRANYIDAMALVRKSAWESVGGYDLSMDERFGGWEDYDLWLRFAHQGFAASFVATPVARYRVHGTSMLKSFNWAPEDAFKELRHRYSDLPWPAG
jgi:GT2 family glycosyltransferase